MSIAPDQISIAHPPSVAWSFVERAAQLIVLLIGGGLGGFVGSIATSWLEFSKLEQQRESENTKFVERYLEQVVHKDIHARFRIAEYMSHVLSSKDQRNAWANYLTAIEKHYDPDDYYNQVKAIEDNSDNSLTFKAKRKLEKIENYLNLNPELRVKIAQRPTADESASKAAATATPVDPTPATASTADTHPAGESSPNTDSYTPSNYQVVTQFAGALPRKEVKDMMEKLKDRKWVMLGVEKGGERTVTAVGTNEIRYGIERDRTAAIALAKDVQASNLPLKGVRASLTPGILPGNLEIWISN